MNAMRHLFQIGSFVCILTHMGNAARAQDEAAADQILAAEDGIKDDNDAAQSSKETAGDGTLTPAEAEPPEAENEVQAVPPVPEPSIEQTEEAVAASGFMQEEAAADVGAKTEPHITETTGGEMEAEVKDYNGAREPDLLDKSIEKFRTPVDRLTEHYLGSASRAVRFDWRESLFSVGILGSELLERNTFGSFRLGGLLRKSFAGAMGEIAATYVFVLSTESSDVLALTPYRQPSRPSRVEVDFNLSYPLFEGVVTPLFDILPASEMVFSVTGGGRYLFYYEVAMGDRNWQSSSTWTNTATYQDISQSLGTAQLLDEDKTRLEDDALGGMAIDPALVHTLVGFTFDTYYQPGLFFSGRALVGVPVLAAASGTQLGFWWEMSLAAGWAF